MRSALDDLQAAVQLLDRGHELGVGLERERGDEPGRPHHAQRVVEERHLGLERRPETLGGQVGRPVERVDQLRIGETQRHRVDREIPARQVGLDVVGERHLGLAALGPVHLGPERGDLDAGVVLLASDGAEPLALEPHADRPSRARARSTSSGRASVATSTSLCWSDGRSRKASRTLPPTR